MISANCGGFLHEIFLLGKKCTGNASDIDLIKPVSESVKTEKNEKWEAFVMKRCIINPN